MKNRFPELQRLAKKLNCTINDDKFMCAIYVEAIDGYSFEGGESRTQLTVYGSLGSYEPEWRKEAITDAIERLTAEPPEKIPFCEI
tara:strand:- start:229 stop:486 length:258 start_codon:yes stop_codon:yes gene_type:complete